MLSGVCCRGTSSRVRCFERIFFTETYSMLTQAKQHITVDHLFWKKKSTVKGAYLNHLMQHKLQRRNRGSLPAGGSVDWFLTSTAPRPRASLVAPTWSAAAGRRLSNNHSPAAAGAAAERTLGVVRCPRRTRGPQHQC
jgi:hypothetical protein